MVILMTVSTLAVHKLAKIQTNNAIRKTISVCLAKRSLSDRKSLLDGNS